MIAIEFLYLTPKKINKMKKNHITKIGFLFVFFQFLSSFVWSQAVFAPKMGAEWNYFFQTDSYDIDVPYFRPVTGISTVNYTKDTLINGLSMKKFEQKQIYKKRKNDTLFSRVLNPSYMIQRNDSVFLLSADTLSLAFVYKTQVGATTALNTPPPNFRFLFNLELKSVGDTTALNNSNVRLKKYTYKSSTPTIVFDIYFTNPLIILDRIGALNADLTVLSTQGQGDNYADGYYLICYQDSEVGLLKFLNRECNSRVSIDEIKTILKDFDISNQNKFITISLQNNDEFIKNAKIYDALGRLVLNIVNVGKNNEITISKNNLPEGLLIISIESNNFQYNAKKIIIHN
jgi:hypothetical protein